MQIVNEKCRRHDQFEEQGFSPAKKGKSEKNDCT